MTKKLTKRAKSVSKIKKPFTSAKKRYIAFLKRRPHRSFCLTRRRDYKRSWNLPGYWTFTNEVREILWSNKWLFVKFMLVYGLFSFIIVGLLSQENYDLLNKSVNQLGGNVVAGELSVIIQNVAIFGGVLSGAFSPNLTEAQQVYSGILFLLGWMSAVWLLRQIMAGHKKIKLRDALYSSGAPLLSTFLVLLVVLIQLIPFALALIAYGAAYSVDVFDDQLFTTIFWIIEFLLILLSTFWLTSSLIGLVVITLPGMYPLKALKASSDLVIGRRLRILYRYGWLIFTIIMIWAIVILPTIFISNVSWLSRLPIVPIVVLMLSTFTILWSSAYIYLLYRKLVSDGTPPA